MINLTTKKKIITDKGENQRLNVVFDDFLSFDKVKNRVLRQTT
jgi:hypothetical protein